MLTAGQAHDVAIGLARAATSGLPEDWSRWASWLRERSGREWLQLDDMARSWRAAGQAPVSGVRGWLGERLDEPSGVVAAVTSWHADGRFRQRATQVLAARGGALAAAALAVRCLDHVPQVRADALAGLRACSSREEAGAALAVLTAGARRHFATEALAEYARTMAQQQDLASLLAELRVAPEPSLRRWAFGYSREQGLLSVEHLVELALRGDDQFLRGAATHALRGQASIEQLITLLGGRFVDGRRLALQELSEEALDDAVLLPLLADRSGRVRELAQWRARRRGHDLAAWYRVELGADAGPGRVTAALDGLSAFGGGEDVALASSFLAHVSPVVRAQAAATVAAGAPAAVVRELLLPLLDDPAPRVSAAAARALSRAGAGAADAERAWLSPLSATRRAAWRLSRAAGSWDRVAADVRAAADPAPVVAGLGRSGLRNWLHAGAATTWGRPAPASAQRLQAALPESGLSVDEQRQVLFHAGLLAPAAPPSADDGRDVPPVRRVLKLLRGRRDLGPGRP